jgi:hypothetical protein
MKDMGLTSKPVALNTAATPCMALGYNRSPRNSGLLAKTTYPTEVLLNVAWTIVLNVSNGDKEKASEDENSAATTAPALVQDVDMVQGKVRV